MVIWPFIGLGVVLLLIGLLILLLPHLMYKVNEFPFVPVGEPALTRGGAEAYMGKGAMAMAAGLFCLVVGIFGTLQ